jgi:hypothetical protein
VSDERFTKKNTEREKKKAQSKISRLLDQFSGEK